VSASDSASQIPGFRDRLGDRIIVPQQSGALLEFLQFCDAFAAAPFFAQALKDRVSQLSSFRHSSYCRVRRLQNVTEGEGRPSLVSAHVAGRRLAEVLDLAARTELKPSTAGVLAVTRQLMASVALLHDFAPYGFHGALGPERLILSAEGRLVVTEHVLGTLVEQAASEWGASRLWQDFRVAVLPNPRSEHYGRRVDIVQVGLVTLAMLLGRPLQAADYPMGIPRILDQLEETTPEGTQVTLRSPLRRWLERMLGVKADVAYRSLLEGQKAFAQLLQDEGYGASSVAWEAFVGVCETAALRVPVVVVGPGGGAALEAPVLVRASSVEPEPAAPLEVIPVVLVPERGEPLPPIEVAPVDPIPVAILPAVAATPEVVSEAGKPGGDPDPASRLREDPFGPWPVPTSTGSAASLFDAFATPSAPPSAAAVLAASTDAPPESVSVASALLSEDVPESTPKSTLQPETLFQAPPPPPVEPAPAVAAPAVQWEPPTQSAVAPVADWGTRTGGKDLSYLVLEGEQPEPEADFDSMVDESDLARASRRDRRIRIGILVGLTALGVILAGLAPYAWKVVFEGRLRQGTLVVNSEPVGAVISVDGQVRGHTPSELSLSTGEHLLEVQVGGSAKSKTLTIKANEKVKESMTFPEAGERGGLMITTYPGKGRISVDGVSRGEAPIKITDLQPGTHTLLVETGNGAQEQDVVVQSGRVAQLAVPTVSWLKVNAPFELAVYEGARLIGTAGAAPVMVAPGRRHLDFVNKSLGLKLRQFVDAIAGQVVTVPLDLPTGMMNLYSDQPAEVLVDGNLVGQTPLPSVQVALGSHDVIFRHPKYGEVRYTVAVTLTAPVKLSVTFSRR